MLCMHIKKIHIIGNVNKHGLGQKVRYEKLEEEYIAGISVLPRLNPKSITVRWLRPAIGIVKLNCDGEGIL